MNLFFQKKFDIMDDDRDENAENNLLNDGIDQKHISNQVVENDYFDNLSDEQQTRDECKVENGDHCPLEDTVNQPQDDMICDSDGDQNEQNKKIVKKEKLSHYQRSDPKPIAVFCGEIDDLTFDKCSASQTYENFIKEAYSKVQKQVEQSRSMIAEHTMQEMGDGLSRLELMDDGRPIRSFGRCYDTTYDEAAFLDKKRAIRTKLRSEDSTASDLSESGCTDEASSSSNEERQPRTWETNSLYGNRRYYSRYDQGRDPDYFDYDLNHSVDLFRKPKFAMAPRAPSYWEHQLFNDKTRIQGSAPISSLMFKKISESESGSGEKTALQTSFISSALRTPSYWEYRYQHMNGSSTKP
uniref:Uncharacterized protein n=1 Tax=Romanomermis culicivorax TaxID=13658 RepID=A0A915ICP7_ROMCU